jgi:hypothetical protein
MRIDLKAPLKIDNPAAELPRIGGAAFQAGAASTTAEEGTAPRYQRVRHD